MKKLMMIAAMIAAFGFGGAAAVAASGDKPPSTPGHGSNDQVCPAGDSGKIDVSGSQASITVTAPDGKLISGYCVKAGSANQGLGPEFYTVSPPAKSVTITHSSGKDISHYSLTFVDEGTHTTDTTHTDTTDTTHTDTTDTTHTDTTHTDTTDTTHTDTTGTTHTDTTDTTGTTQTETTGTTQTETTETTTTEETSTEEEPQVFTPPTADKPAKNNGGPAVAGVVQAPSTAAQAAPLTP